MIENFSYVSENGISLFLNLGVDVYLFEGNDELMIMSFFRSKGSGVKWENSGHVNRILETGKYIIGKPTPDMRRVVVVYPADHPVYPAPGNAVVYNADGSRYRQLIICELVSDMAKERKKRDKFSQYWRPYFEDVTWKRNNDGKVVIAARIGFDRDWWELRVLNADTGELCECLTSGQR